MDPIIEFKDYTFKYRAQKEPTLYDINLSIYPGEKILIVGQSGSGKSTLAHCINALNPCAWGGESTGTLRVDGDDPASLGVFGMSKKVGTVLQDTDGQFIGLTVAEDIAFALENDAVPQDEMKSKVMGTAEKVRMSDFLSSAPGELSGGQKQRVSLGGVMVDDVKVLLFDEPLANLDPSTGKRTIELIDDIMRDEDVTVVIIEHRLEDVLHRPVDRIILMEGGRIVADQKPDELLASGILPEHGIREPLYLAAMRHAGASVSADDRPSSVADMDISRHADTIREWFLHTDRVVRNKGEKKVLEVRDLCFGYDREKAILSDISFSIHEGEMVSLVGKNGAGKSTLASLICGFYKPDSGSVLLEGSDISPLSIKERGEKIGYVMQSPNQMISKPMIRDEVGLGLLVRGAPEDEINQRVEETLRICGLYPFRNWPVSALSFGQKKRVSIASILVMKPRIMILDEPTAGQDFAHYTEIMEFLKKLRDETGLTMIMITHDMHLMLEYTDHALVLSDGHLLMDDTPARVLTDDDITERAYLKRTSLYDLATSCGIEPPKDFVDRFIEHERMERSKAV
ncbi:MAG: ABC transporter ATP-binding protein [Lachnospiraceae bacterium]|nr:ABC transporter ATP-binding protein [Lachnospiraceae bacterium]